MQKKIYGTIDFVIDSVISFGPVAGVIVLAWIVFSSCATPAQQLDDAVAYRKDMELQVNGMRGEGLVLAPEAASYDIRGKFPDDADRLSFKTCARYRPALDEGDSWRYTFVPDEIERADDCRLAEIVSFNEKGRHAFGAVVFRSARSRLPAHLVCNGEAKDDTETVCSNLQGMPFRIRFQAPVDMAPGPECGIPNAPGVTELELPMPRGLCVIHFREHAPARREHHLTLFGFEQDPIR
jgi:hypothetical protein